MSRHRTHEPPEIVFPELWARLVTDQGAVVGLHKLGRLAIPPQVVVDGRRVFRYEGRLAGVAHNYVETTAMFVKDGDA
jgi:hypothetical protein